MSLGALRRGAQGAGRAATASIASPRSVGARGGRRLQRRARGESPTRRRGRRFAAAARARRSTRAARARARAATIAAPEPASRARSACRTALATARDARGRALFAEPTLSPAVVRRAPAPLRAAADSRATQNGRGRLLLGVARAVFPRAPQDAGLVAAPRFRVVGERARDARELAPRPLSRLPDGFALRDDDTLGAGRRRRAPVAAAAFAAFAAVDSPPRSLSARARARRPQPRGRAPRRLALAAAAALRSARRGRRLAARRGREWSPAAPCRRRLSARRTSFGGAARIRHSSRAIRPHRGRGRRPCFVGERPAASIGALGVRARPRGAPSSRALALRARLVGLARLRAPLTRLIRPSVLERGLRRRTSPPSANPAGGALAGAQRAERCGGDAAEELARSPSSAAAATAFDGRSLAASAGRTCGRRRRSCRSTGGPDEPDGDADGWRPACDDRARRVERRAALARAPLLIVNRDAPPSAVALATVTWLHARRSSAAARAPRRSRPPDSAPTRAAPLGRRRAVVLATSAHRRRRQGAIGRRSRRARRARRARPRRIARARAASCCFSRGAAARDAGDRRRRPGLRADAAAKPVARFARARRAARRRAALRDARAPPACDEAAAGSFIATRFHGRRSRAARGRRGRGGGDASAAAARARDESDGRRRPRCRVCSSRPRDAARDFAGADRSSARALARASGCAQLESVPALGERPTRLRESGTSFYASWLLADEVGRESTRRARRLILEVRARAGRAARRTSANARASAAREQLLRRAAITHIAGSGAARARGAPAAPRARRARARQRRRRRRRQHRRRRRDRGRDVRGAARAWSRARRGRAGRALAGRERAGRRGARGARGRARERAGDLSAPGRAGARPPPRAAAAEAAPAASRRARGGGGGERHATRPRAGGGVAPTSSRSARTSLALNQLRNAVDAQTELRADAPA